MRSQIEQLLKQANALPNFPNHQHQHLLKVLNENKCPDIRFDDIPDYSFENLKKGIYCATCGSLSLAFERNNARCKACQSTDKIADMLVRSVYEYTVLFPDMKIKPVLINEWCGGHFERHRIARAVKRYREMEQTFGKIEGICSKIFKVEHTLRFLTGLCSI